MEKNVITIYEVAEKAGVSTATVSKIVNHKGRISETTRQHVLQIMKDLNYRPSSLAACLTTKKTATIGLLIPDIANPYFGEVARLFDTACRQKGYMLIICNTNDVENKAREDIELLVQKRVDGIIIACNINKQETIESLIQFKIPIIQFSAEMLDAKINTINVDEYLGTYTAVEYLINLGCRNICFIGGRGIGRKSNKTRAYYDAIKKYGLDPMEKNTNERNSDIFGSLNEVEKILRSAGEVDGIFACSDLIGVGALQAAKALGFQVPHQLKVIGFDNTILSELSSPRLSVVSQPIHEMVVKAVDLLLENMKSSEGEIKKIKFPPKLILREST